MYHFLGRIASILWWCITNPLKAILIIAVIVLVTFGIVYSLRFLLKPSTYGIGNGKETGKQARPSIILAICYLILIISIGISSFVAMRQMENYYRLGNEYEDIATQIQLALDTLNRKGQNLNTALVSINDTMTEGMLDLMGEAGSAASYHYIRSLEESMSACKTLKEKASKFKSLIAEMYQIRWEAKAEADRLYLTMGPIGKGLQSFAVLRMFCRLGLSFAEIMDAFAQGDEELYKFFKIAEHFLPDHILEAHTIKDAFDKDIRKGLSKDAAKIILPSIDLSVWEEYLQNVNRDTVGKAERISKRLRLMAIKDIMTTVMLLISGVLAMFMNRLKYSMLGIISLVMMGILILGTFTGNIYLNELEDSTRSICNSLGKEEGKTLLADLGNGVRITTGMLRQFSKAIEKGDNLPEALQKSFGKGEHFNRKLKITNTLVIIKDKNGTLPIPINGEFGNLISNTYNESISHITRKGAAIDEVLKVYRDNAKECSNASRLSFPKSWKKVVYLAPRFSTRVAVVMNGYAKLAAEGHHFQAKYLLNAMLEQVHKISGLTKMIMEISDRIEGACSAQSKALDDIEYAAKHPSILREDRLGNLKTKSQQLIDPVLNGKFINIPLEKCVKSGCLNTEEKFASIRGGNGIMMISLVLSLAVTIFLAKIPHVIWRGLKFLFPVFEVTNILSQ